MTTYNVLQTLALIVLSVWMLLAVVSVIDIIMSDYGRKKGEGDSQ